MNQHKGGCVLCIACCFKFIYKNKTATATSPTCIYFSLYVYVYNSLNMCAPNYIAYTSYIYNIKQTLQSQSGLYVQNEKTQSKNKTKKRMRKKIKEECTTGIIYCKVRTSNSGQNLSAKILRISGRHNTISNKLCIFILYYCSSFIFIRHLPITPLCSSIHSFICSIPMCCHIK